MYYTLIISENYITKLYLKFNLLKKLSLTILWGAKSAKIIVILLLGITLLLLGIALLLLGMTIHY